MADYEVRYLDIAWSDRETVRKLLASQEALELKKTSEGHHVETITFPSVFHYIGFSVNADNVKHSPYLVRADGSRQELTSLKVPVSKEVWWILRGEWDRKNKRYFSSLYREAGRVSLVIEGELLTIENNTINFSVSELEYYLADFKNSLWMLILNDNSATKANVSREIPDCFDDRTLDLFGKYVKAVEKLIRKPSVNLIESQGKVPRRSVRPVPRTFRECATQPFAKTLTSRIYLESYNTAENRYIFYTVKRVLYLMDSLSRLASAQTESFDHRIRRELELKGRYENRHAKKIDQQVYDNEISSLEDKLRKLNESLEALVSSSRSSVISVSEEHQDTVSVNFSKSYGNWKNCFFCKMLEGGRILEEHEYLVAKLPESASSFVAEYSAVIEDNAEIRELVIKGKFSLEEHESSNGKKFVLLKFFELTEARAGGNSGDAELARYVAKRKFLNDRNWTVPLTAQDIADRNMEIGVISRRIEVYEKLREHMSGFYAPISVLRKRLSKVESFFCNNDVKQSAIYPNSMIFIQNESYGSAKILFNKINKLSGLSENILNSLVSIDEIGLVNISNLYEKWCLVKIIETIKNVFGFTLEGDWQSLLVSSILSKQYNIELQFRSFDRQQSIIFTYEKELDSGVRPDYVIDLKSKIYEIERKGNKSEWVISGEKNNRFILDAKFRGDISEQEMQELVQDLYSGKNYSENGVNQVFIIHPSPDVVGRRTSPLDWGRDCDYGQSDNITHDYGSIFMSPSLVRFGSSDNLQRLIGMFLQSSSVILKEETENLRWTNMGCISCGNSEISNLNLIYQPTDKGNPAWLVECRSCAMKTKKTRCFSCRHPLFKNGEKWTYHRTRADQKSNIICPKCESFF